MPAPVYDCFHKIFLSVPLPSTESLSLKTPQWKKYIFLQPTAAIISHYLLAYSASLLFLFTCFERVYDGYHAAFEPFLIALSFQGEP